MIIPALQFLTELSSLTELPLYLVGGSVRDLLIGKPDIKDIDLAMPADSEVAARLFADRIGGSFFFLDENRKITRVVKPSDHGVIQFDFANFEGLDLAADLGRRDFTVNAMALDLREFIAHQSAYGLIDPFHGLDDVRARLIRATRPDVLTKDPLRLLRAVRFAATLGFAIEENTASWIRDRAGLIVLSSPERQRDELFLILAERGSEAHLLLLDSLGLLTRLLPELEPLRGFAPGRYHVHDVLTHAVKTVGYLDDVLDDLPGFAPAHAASVRAHLEEPLEHLVPRKAALRFACLLHDMAKPETFTDTDDRVRFLGHDSLGAERAGIVCRRLRLSRDTEKAVVSVIRQHMRLFNLASPGGPSRNAVHRYCRDMGEALPESLLLSQADARATFEIMPKEKFADTEQTMALVLDYYYTRYLKTEAAPLVTGDDLIRMGRAPGPRFREILEDVKEKQAEGVLRDRQEALAYLERFR